MGNEKLKMRDCVLTAAVLLQLDDVVSALENVVEPLGGEVEKVVNQLVRCGNLVLSGLAQYDLPLRKIEKIICPNNSILFAQFSQNPIDIYSVKFNKKSVPIREYFDRILLPCAGEYEIDYSYEPVPLDLGGVSDYSSIKPSARIVAYGIAGEYCLISGMNEESAMWDKRFRDNIYEIKIVKREQIMRTRAWL